MGHLWPRNDSLLLNSYRLYRVLLKVQLTQFPTILLDYPLGEETTNGNYYQVSEGDSQKSGY